MKQFDVLRVPTGIMTDGWDMEGFYDLSGSNLPTRSSERATMIQILVACDILESEEDATFITDHDLDQILLENNIYVKFIDSTTEEN